MAGSHLSPTCFLSLCVRRLSAPAAALAVGAAANALANQPPEGLSRRAVEALSPRLADYELVLSQKPGPDVDGDGAPDFTNPTGQEAREVDGYGSGAFHASRDGGAREHAGVDYLSVARQAVRAPISGYVTGIGYAYEGDARLRYVELTNRAIGYLVRVFYLEPAVGIGQAVRLGQPIGEALSLQARYPGISDHVHVETSRIGRGYVDPTPLIPQPVWRFARVGEGGRS